MSEKTYTITVEFRKEEDRLDDEVELVWDVRINAPFVTLVCINGRVFVYHMDSIRHFNQEPDWEIFRNDS
jgi:hypothetical protein